MSQAPARTPSLDYRAAEPGGGMLTQTVALFVDAYRELNSKKLFWITLIISALVVLAFACVGINERGITVLHWEFASPFNTGVFPREKFYKFVFSAVAIPIWLAWAASILAIVSTSSIFPDLLTGGSIDLYLSKPIGRLRLFLTKFATGLVFVGMQVGVFTVASFFIIGIRGGSWEPAIFLSIPVVLLFFSYLFSVCVLCGVVTRSTIASILLTILAWFIFYGVSTTETILQTFRTVNEHRVATMERNIADWNGKIDKLNNSTAASRPEGLIKNYEFQRDLIVKDMDSAKASRDNFILAHRIAFAVKTPLPKTTETVDLLRRALVQHAEMPDLDDSGEERQRQAVDERRRQRIAEHRDFEKEAKTLADVRPIGWVIGTSLGFEACVLLLASWIFCRRDF